MDHELRTDFASDKSIKNLSVASADTHGKDSDMAVLSNLLSSMDAGEGGSGPANIILREMGILPPRRPRSDKPRAAAPSSAPMSTSTAAVGATAALTHVDRR